MRKAIQKSLGFILTLLLGLGGFPFALAEEGEEPVDYIYVSFQPLLCGEVIEEARPVQAEEDETFSLAQPNAWVASVNPDNPEEYEPWLGQVEGGVEIAGLLALEAGEGYCFTEDLSINLSDPETYEPLEYELLFQSEHRVILFFTVLASHPWDESKHERRDPTCVDPGWTIDVCSYNPDHISRKEISPSPYYHVFGEWQTVKEPTKQEDGLRERSCIYCEEKETEILPRITLPYTKVCEPETSFVMASTIAWEADETLPSVMEEEKRPASVFLWLDASLNIYDKNGNLLSDDIDSFIPNLSLKMIPVFYISDAETASALKDWLWNAGMADCFVVSGPENQALVKDVADLLHIRGMLDYSGREHCEREDLIEMIASTNGAHGKVILLSEAAADYETVRKLQSLASTVWVKSSGDTKSLLTQYTNGVNGIVSEDYEAAIHAQEFFQDDSPSLLRIPFVIGHRGDPSVYVENTLDSAIGAYEEGADSIENDIQLSADGELFILHDETMVRLLDVQETDEEGNPIWAETWPLAKIQEQVFSWKSIVNENEVTPENSRYGNLYGQEEEKEYHVPAYRDYLETFKGKDIVHDTEIKSFNPAILPVYKALVDEYDAWDQVFSITFNEDILNALYEQFPELSIGVLGFPMKGRVMDYMAELDDYEAIAAEDGTEAAVYALFRDLDRWNATYNPVNYMFGKEVVKAARHRGLTVWPWTYTNPASFAADYLDGMSGLTTDYPWQAEALIVRILSEDVASVSKEEMEKPLGITQKDAQTVLESAQAVEVEKLSDTESLMIWRYPAQFIIDGVNYGEYYLYSNPFVWTHIHDWKEPEYSWKSDDTEVTAKRVCRADESHAEEETVQTVRKTVKPATEKEEGEMTITAEFSNPAFETQRKTVILPKKKPSGSSDAKEGGNPVTEKPSAAVRTPDTSDRTNLTLWALLFAGSSCLSACLLLICLCYPAP